MRPSLCGLWHSAGQRLQLDMLITLVTYLSVSAVGVCRPGPLRKDMVMLEWARAHVELGLGVTKGYNLSTKWAVAPSEVNLGTRNVYLSAPPLQTLFSAAAYRLCSLNWRVLRLVPVLLGLVYLLSCVIVSIKYLDGPARSWLLYFSLSPMILINSTVIDVNAGNLGLLVLSYVCFTKYLETGEQRWIICAGLSYLLAFWISYVALSVVPPMLAQAAIDRGLPWERRRRAVLFGFGFVALGVGGAVAHLVLLPGALTWVVTRAVYRFSVSTGGVTRTQISLWSFVVRQSIRMVTHYTPICVVLGGMSLLILVGRRKAWSARKMQDESYVVSSGVVLSQFFLWGLPFGALAVNNAYIHPVSLYYFAIFMAYGSAFALDWITDGAGHMRAKRIFGHWVVAVFLVLSIGRSVFTISGGSLPALVAGRLPAWVTTGLGEGDSVGGDSVIPRDQW
jgi:hypothetical protein